MLWRAIEFPAVSDGTFVPGPMRSARLQERDVTIVPTITIHGPSPNIDWYSGNAVPSRIVYACDYAFALAPIWDGEPAVAEGIGITAPYPPNWKSLAGAGFDTAGGATRIIWNAAHPLAAAASESDFRWLATATDYNCDPLPVRKEILSSRSRAAAWVLACLKQTRRTVWEGLKDRDASFLPELFALLGDDRCVLFWSQELYGDGELNVLTETSWKVIQSANGSPRFNEIAPWLPDPGSDWTLSLDRRANCYEKIAAAGQTRKVQRSNESD